MPVGAVSGSEAAQAAAVADSAREERGRREVGRWFKARSDFVPDRRFRSASGDGSDGRRNPHRTVSYGTNAAEWRGELAALALLVDLGRGVPTDRIAALRRKLARLRRFRAALDAAFPVPDGLAASLPDDVLLCRCEAITVGELRAAARDLDATELNRAKAFTRIGMGRCQGRVCERAAAEVLAAALDVPLERVGWLRAQAPVKPIPIGP